MSGKHLVLRGDARRIPLADGSVALIVTSPPYWAQRSYRDAGGHYDGQIGSEPHPRQWLEAMFEVMKECWRVLAPGGSVFVNLGDKRAGSGGHNNSGISARNLPGMGSGYAQRAKYLPSEEGKRATRRNAPDRYEQAHFGRRKSRQAIPERFLQGCIDGLASGACASCGHTEGAHPAFPKGWGNCKKCTCLQYVGLGWIWRSGLVEGNDEVVSPWIWEKPNGLPESVTDRFRDNWESIFHLTKSERYFAAIDEIREPHVEPKSSHSRKNGDRDAGPEAAKKGSDGVGRDQSWVVREREYNPLGKVPGSVWRIASEPLRIPDWAKEKYNLPDHFAAFPTEIPRRLILGFSPSGICTACNEPRRPVVEKTKTWVRPSSSRDNHTAGHAREQRQDVLTEVTITGYACRCPDTSAPTRNAVVLDVFGGTGTTALVAENVGRTGISLDLSSDYCNLARWRIEESGHGTKAEQKTWGERQGTML